MSFANFLINSKHWLSGSIRIQLTPAERSVWADLLALANESRERGVICRAKGLPYSMEYLATYLSIDIELLQSTIDKCLLDYNADDDKTRISIDEYGCIVINNWNRYQVDEKRWRLKKEGEKELARLRAEESKRKAKEKAQQLDRIDHNVLEVKDKIDNNGHGDILYVDKDTGEIVNKT
jgi:hypothetical protein